MKASLDGSVLFGGSFDPLHTGHEYIIELLHTTYRYNCVYLIPAQKNRIRYSQPIASFKHRVRMCRLVAQRHPAAQLIKHTHQYAQCQTIYHTLQLLKQDYTWNDRIHVAIGDDLISELQHWYRFDTIKHQLKFVILQRDADHADIDHQLSQLNVSYQMVQNELQPMRSSSLRALLETGEYVHQHISQPIYNYIVRKRLYNVSVDHPQQAVHHIKRRLYYEVTAMRRKHIRGVVQLISQLNRAHNYDAQQLKLAALAHDWAREWPHSHLTALVMAHRPLTTVETVAPILCHGFVASKLLLSTLPYVDQQVLEAVAHHTLGKNTMSNPILSMLYVVDYLEPSRKLFSKKQTKQLIKLPINHVMAFVIEHCIQQGLQPSAITHSWHQSIINTLYHD